MTQTNEEIIIVNSYVNSLQKEIVLRESLTQLKKLGKQILLMSNSIMTTDSILALCNYHIYNSENLLLPTEKSPVTWYADSKETVHLYNKGINLSIIRNINIALHFVKNLGFKKFIYLEYDNIFHDDDLILLDQMLDTLNEKKAFFCRFNDYDQLAYETRIFSGDVDFFAHNIPLPKNYDEWNNTYPYSTNTETLEYIFPILFRDYIDHIEFYEGGNGYFFKNSDIDIFRSGTDVNVVYNKADPNNPLVFIVGIGADYTIAIDDMVLDKVWLHRNQIKKQYFDISNKTVKVAVTRNGDTKSFDVGQHNIEEFKIYGVRMDI